MRILLAAHAFPPRSVAGVEVYTLRLGSALAALGHAVRVVAAAHDVGQPHRRVASRRVGPLDVVQINNLHGEGGLGSSYRSAWLDDVLSRVVEEHRPQCVHVQHLLNLSTGIVSAARTHAAAVVLTLHDHWMSCAREGLRMQADFTLCESVELATCAACLRRNPHLVTSSLQGAAMRVAARSGLGMLLGRVRMRTPRAATALWHRLGAVALPEPDELRRALGERRDHLKAVLDDVSLVVAPTRFVRERAVELGLSEERIRVVPIGVPAMSPSAANRASDVRRFGYIGTLAPHKGVHVLVRAFRELGRDLRLEIHGDERVHPEYARSLKDLAASDKRITFCGPFAEGEQAHIFGRIDALVVPSLWWEVGPLTLLEARAAGVPVIATTLGSMPELLEGTWRSALVPPGDVDALRAAMEAIVEAEPGGPERSRERSVEDEARDLETLYRSLADGDPFSNTGAMP